MRGRCSGGTLALVALLLYLPTLSNAQDGAVIIDHIDGTGNGQIVSGPLVKFHFRIQNNTADQYYGTSNGFIIWSPDGAVWDSTRGEFTDAYLGLAWFSKADNHFDADMVYYPDPPAPGVDSAFVQFNAFSLYADSGLSPGWDEIGWTIAIGPVDIAHVGKTICIDSSFTPPGGTWGWGSQSGGPKVYPEWGGPYCYTITDECCFGSMTGNVNWDLLDVVDVVDLTMLIDHLFISFVDLPCPEEANVTGSGGIDVADLTELINFLFISFEPLGACP